MYIVKNRVKIKKTRNNSTRIEAKCVEGCPWRMIAVKDSRVECMLIKTYVGEHTCERVWEVKELTAPLLAGKFVEDFRDDPKMNLTAFQNKLQKKYNMKPNKFKLARARLYCLKKIRGDEEAQYGQLWDYGHELRRANPGTTFFLKRMGETLSTLYLCLDACKRGFLQGCRPVIFIDGCDIKTRYRGQLLVAVGTDPNNCIFPIAIGVVDVEDMPNWVWVLERLKMDLGIINTSPWTIMSDKQKGLINAVNDVFPESEHRFCVRHMWKNFQQLYKGDALKNQLWKIARSTTVIKYEQYMLEMKVLNEGAYNWLKELEPNTWVRAFQSDIPKCDILLNNLCQVFNK